MSRKIRIGMSKGGCDAAAKELRDYATKLQHIAAPEISHRLSEIAAEEAATHFSGDVSVTPMGNGVLAVGESVVFQEFGAGSRISDPYPGGTDADIEIRRGAYSDLHEGEYAQTGYQYWHHDGERYEFVTPANGLFHGMMAAQEQAGKVAREVLGEI